MILKVHILRQCFIIHQLFLSSVEGLHAIVVSDRDGVPVIKGKTPQLHVSAMFAFEYKCVYIWVIEKASKK